MFFKALAGILNAFDTASKIYDDGIFDETTVEPPGGPNYPLDTPNTLNLEAQLQAELQQAKKEAAKWKHQAESIPQQHKAYLMLGVLSTAPDWVVKAAYRAAARRAHSDHGGSDAAMSELNKAYEEISKMRGWT